jgi:hypothetical protein
MKRLPRRHLSLNCASVLLLTFLAAADAVAAIIPTEWQHRQTLNVAAPGLVRVDLTAASFDAAGPQQEDLRVTDANGREVALLLDRPASPTARVIRPESFDVKLEPETTRINVVTGTTAGLSALTLETPHPFFLRAATVEISDDNTHWTTLDQGVPLFRQWGAEKLELSLGGRTAAFVRVTVNDHRVASVPFTGAHLSLNAGPPPALVPVGAKIASRDEFAGETVLTLALDGRHAPLASLELPASDPLFMRRVTLSVREVNGGVSSERVIGSGTVYRVALDGAPARAELEVPLEFTPLTREVLVHIHNGDSPPLSLDAVQLKRRALNLFFMAPAAGNYTLLSGNPQATVPRYDLAAFAGEMRAAGATTVVPGELEAMPGYHPRESLGSAPLPDVPLTGAPLEAKAWSYRKSLQLNRAGVQELELDPSVLAQSQSDFGDLRLLRAGNQIPYVLEQSALARALTLNPIASPEAKRPTVSAWQLHLPHAGLPLRRLVLTSATPLFQRQFRIYEKLTNQNGGTYEITLASGQWSRTPDPAVPETEVFEMAERARTDTLWIETDNGDNPAVALGAVQVVYPVVRLIFKTAETEGLVLAYGNASANAPRYDLNLVAVKLLTSPRNPARLSADEATSAGSGNPFAGLNGGYVFWGVLGLVVIALLVVVARLLPKPPAS